MSLFWSMLSHYIHRIRPKLVALWLICAVILPAVVSHIFLHQSAEDHGVLVTNSAGSWYEPSIQAAFNHLTKPEALKQEIQCHFWSPKKESYFVVVKGKRKIDFKVNSTSVLHKENKMIEARMIEVPQGWSLFQIQIQPDTRDLVDPVTIVWSNPFHPSKEIPANQSYTQQISDTKARQEKIATILGIIARTSTLLLFFWIIFQVVSLPFFTGADSRITIWIAAAAFVLIIALRFSGITYLVEEGLHPDEKLYGGMIQEVRQGILIPSKFWYTSGYFFITAAAERLSEWVAGVTLPQNLIQRSVSAICSSLTCVLIFNIARTFFSFEAAIFAMLFMGLGFMPVELAHYGIVEPTMVFFFVLSFASFLNISQKPSLKRFATAGLFAGAAVAVKQTAALIGLPFLIMWIYLLKEKKISRTGISELLTTTASAFLGFFVLSPGTILELNKFYQYQKLQTKSLEGVSQTHNFFVEQHHFGGLAWKGLHSGMGYPLIIAAIIGSVLIWKRSKIAAWLSVPMIAAYLVLIGSVEAVPEHYVLILCPFVALFAAAALDSIPQSINKSRNWLLGGIALLLIAFNAPQIFTLEKLFQGTDTRQQAVEWCYQNLPPGSKIDSDLFGPRFLIPMFETARVRLFDRPPLEHYMSESEPDYFIQDSLTASIFLDAPKEYFSHERRWYGALHRIGVVKKEFRHDEFRLLNPTIRIYELPLVK